MIQSRASRGSVSLDSYRDRLRLRLPRELYGKPKYITLGLADTPENRAIAESIRAECERDIKLGMFDFSWNKYIPAKRNSLASLEGAKSKPQPKLDEIWQRYTESKKHGSSPSTLRMYKWVTSHIDGLPSHSLENAIEIRDYVLKNVPPGSAKRLLMHFQACCTWAVESKLIEANPFYGMQKKVKVQKKKVDEDEDIYPFTAEERDRIIHALENAPLKGCSYRAYASFIKFLFFTGCRPSEAVALRWKDIRDGHIHFERAVVVDENYKHVEKEGLKTQKRRKIRINSQLQEILDSAKPEHCNPDDLIFPSPRTKGWINIDNLGDRGWTWALESAGIEYRRLYQTRHTFICLCLDKGRDAKNVAQWVGNSPEIIYKHYANHVRHIDIPEL